MIRLLKALWISARPGVMPSVFSNVMLGWCLGGGFSAGISWLPTVFPWSALLVTALGGLCFYLYGMWGNDFMDADWDTRHRAKRPVPLGMIGRVPLGICLLISAGCGLWLLCSWEALTLVLCITAYNLLHKAWSGSVVFMGACRGLLVYVAAMGTGMEPHFLLYPAIIALSLYVAGVTWWAREEHKFPERIPVVGVLLSWLPLYDAVWLAISGMFLPAIFCVGCFVASKLLRKMGARMS